jgi:hypothetical protein
MSQNRHFFRFCDIQKLKMLTFKRFWDTMECTEKLRDLSERAREDKGDMERYWDIMEGVRDIMGNKERLGNDRFFRPNYEKDRLVVGYHRGLLGKVGEPGGVHAPPGGLQGQAGVPGVVHGRHGGVNGQFGVHSVLR